MTSNEISQEHPGEKERHNRSPEEEGEEPNNIPRQIIQVAVLMQDIIVDVEGTINPWHSSPDHDEQRG